MDNKFHDDFDEGELSTFQGDVLGECDGFDIGKALDWSGCMTLYHSGIFFFYFLKLTFKKYFRL